MTTTTYLGSGDVRRQRRDYRPAWLDNLADDVTMEGRFNDAGQAARIVVNHRPLGSVLLWSQLMAEHFAGTDYAQYFFSAAPRA